MRARALALLGGLGAAGYLLGHTFGPPLVRVAAKPLPALCLALWAGTFGDRYARFLTAGLVLSALGDLLLEGDGLFLAGLAAFLLAHLAYVAAFWSETPALRPLRALPFLAYGVAAFAFLRPGLGAMAVPVAAYVTAICTMMWRAAARLGASPRGTASGRAALLGAVLFAASDSLIALDRFHAPIAGVHYAIIVLYWAGQVGIASSAGRAEAGAIR